jgi:mRNA interferase MazF
VSDIRRGQVWMADLDPVRGHEQGRVRPVLIVSDDVFNQGPSNLIIILPMTGTVRGIASHIEVAAPEGGLHKSSVILCDQVRTISKGRLGRLRGAVSAGTLAKVEGILRFLLNL